MALGCPLFEAVEPMAMCSATLPTSARAELRRSSRPRKTSGDARFCSLYLFPLDFYLFNVVCAGGWMLKLTENPTLAFLSMRGRESWRFDFLIDGKRVYD